MKNFDDFVKYVNESKDVQSALSNVKLSIESDSLNLANSEDISKLIFSAQEQTLNQFMKILRTYHEWVSEN